MSRSPLDVVLWGLSHDPASVHLIDFSQCITHARVIKKAHPMGAYEVGQLRASVPAMVARAVKAAKDDPSQADLLLLTHIRRESYDSMLSRMESGVILLSDPEARGVQ